MFNLSPVVLFSGVSNITSKPEPDIRLRTEDGRKYYQRRLHFLNIARTHLAVPQYKKFIAEELVKIEKDLSSFTDDTTTKSRAKTECTYQQLFDRYLVCKRILSTRD